jgi:hypothetical protein
MNKYTFAALVACIAGGALAQSSQAPVDPSGDARAQRKTASEHVSTLDPGYDLYRRVVLGDTSVPAPTRAQSAETGGRWVPGPYARYLMNHGVSESDALAQALRIGERATFVASEVPGGSPALSPYGTYQRSVLGVSESEILQQRR